MKKPKFDPNAGFETVNDGSAPRFDPGAKFETVEDPGIVESALRGAAQGVTMGFADEIAGAVEAALTEKDYKTARDESRRNFEDAERANSLAYNIGDVGGSIGSAFIPGLGVLNAGKGARLLQVAGKGALQGGISGLGRSEKEDIVGQLADSATGAAIGGALGGTIYGAGKLAAKGGEALDSIGGKKGLKHIADTMWQEAKSEGSAAANTLDGILVGHGLPPVMRIKKTLGAAGKGINEAKLLAAEKGEFEEVVKGIEKAFGETGEATATKAGASIAEDLTPKSASVKVPRVKSPKPPKLSDNDLLMQRLLAEGIDGEPNEAHRLVAQKFAAAHGGDADSYLQLITRSADELAEAQRFDAIEAGESLAPKAQRAFDDIKTAAGKQYESLKSAARESFKPQDSTPVKVLSDAIQEANKYKSISGSTRSVLDDVFADLVGRDGQPSFTQLSAQDQFDRLLDAKQRLGKAVKWANKNELPEGQQILAGTYSKFQSLLQSLEDMAKADKGYAGFKSLENNLFKKLGTVERGRIKEFDPIKLERLFGGGSTSRKLLKEVERAKEMLESGLLPPDQALSVRELLSVIDDFSAKASLKREVTNFRYKDAGPSSPAIQRMSAIAGRDSATTTAVRAPQMFLKMKAAAADASQQIFNRPYSKLNPKEQQVVAEYALWLSQNDGASDAMINKKINQLLSNLK